MSEAYFKPSDAKQLAKDFIPSEQDVICGWARQNYHHAGNQRLRQVIMEHVPRYQLAKTKSEKGTVILDIVQLIRSESPTGVGMVRMCTKTNRWWSIGTDKAKDKVGHALRKATQEWMKQQQRKKKGSNKGNKREQSAAARASSLRSPQRYSYQQHSQTRTNATCPRTVSLDNEDAPKVSSSTTNHNIFEVSSSSASSPFKGTAAVDLSLAQLEAEAAGSTTAFDPRLDGHYTTSKQQQHSSAGTSSADPQQVGYYPPSAAGAPQYHPHDPYYHHQYYPDPAHSYYSQQQQPQSYYNAAPPHYHHYYSQAAAAIQQEQPWDDATHQILPPASSSSEPTTSK